MQLSLIIPYDGYLKYLEDCLDSVKNQSIEDYETILLIDEGHPIDDIKENYQDINLKIITCGQDASVSTKRNIGLNEAQGEYVYFLDSDDYLMNDTLSRLLEDGKQTHYDLITGRRLITWFKRDVFLGMEFESNEERSANSKDADKNNKFLEKDYSGCDDMMLQQAIDTLIRARRGYKNISVLNILIKRDIIDQHHLRFNEDFIYYSDLPFLIELLKSSHTFMQNRDAIYAKRKHNDPINTPALSQIKDPENKFDEFIAAYRYTISLVDKGSPLRYYLDSKLIKYYGNYFAKRLRRSNNDYWRNERFITMCELMRDTRDDLIKKMSPYQRKMVKLARKGDLKATQRVIAQHLGKVKAKKILKNKNEFNKYLYRNKYTNEPIEDNWVMFETFMGKSYADSPKYIYEYLAKNYPGQYKFIWVLNDPHAKIPYDGIVVKRFTKKYAYYLGKCKYFVFNIRQPLWFRKREGQVFLETWHGTPLKRLAFDQEEVTAASPTYKAQFYRQKQEWDYLIAANKFSSDIFKSCFMYDGNMLEVGYPRNDLMYDPHKDEIAKSLKEKLGIPKDKKTILYAPTWRDDEYYGKGQYKFKLKLDLQKMKDALGDEYVVLLRTHHYIADSLDVTGVEDFAINLSKYDDITEIYLVSDICITDYSSVFFDFANLRRPMIFYTYDIDKYRDVLRGFYISMEDELPGPLVYSTEDVIDTIKNIEAVSEKYHQRYDQFYDRFCSIDDGNASKRTVEAVFK